MNFDNLIQKYINYGYEETDAIINVITYIFNNKRYRSMLSIADNNWLDISIDNVIDNILKYFNNLL